MADENIHKGHRQKLKNRILMNGLAGEAPHTILELLLFYGIPYKDTNPIAHELLDRFGSLSGVLRAGVEELKSVKGMTENAALEAKNTYSWERITARLADFYREVINEYR